MAGIVAGHAATGPGARRGVEADEERVAAGFPVQLYALGGTGPGVPLRATVAAFGPVLLAGALGLDLARERTLGWVFGYGDARGWS